MNIELKQVTIDEKEILKNLLEKYEYEFSQWDKRDVNKLGLYGYRYLDYYWTEDCRWAYFILVDDKLAGFATVIDLPEVDDRKTDFQMAEFFVLYKYRRSGIGKQAFFKVGRSLEHTHHTASPGDKRRQRRRDPRVRFSGAGHANRYKTWRYRGSSLEVC